MATATEIKKKKTVRMNGCVASAQAAKYADVDVITAYPIRPYTATMMALAQMVANGELDAEYIVADSEHSQLSIAHGASSSGARVFTGSSGVGVQFAYELYSPISGTRMPVQMMIADRTLDPPGDFGSEHTDALSTRDMGWLMGWSCDAQEAFDNHLMAFRIGEDRRVLFDRYELVDVAVKVVGIGSVGTLCMVALMMSVAGHPFFLQVKEANESVLEAYAGKSLHSNHGQRIVHGVVFFCPLRLVEVGDRGGEGADRDRHQDHDEDRDAGTEQIHLP